MSRPATLSTVLLFVTLPAFALAAETVYRSVDEAGRVTYSSKPPKGAVDVQGIEVVPGPSAEAAESAQAQARDRRQQADAEYRALMERRQSEAQRRREAQEATERERDARERTERLQRIEESLETLANERSYLRRPYPHHWRWPHPHRSFNHPRHPPPPVYWNPRHSRPYDGAIPNRGHINRPSADQGHINTPARRQ